MRGMHVGDSFSVLILITLVPGKRSFETSLPIGGIIVVLAVILTNIL